MTAKKKLLIFDTETAGMPRSWKAPVTDTRNWPRVVQLAWLLIESDGKELNRESHIIKPIDFRISPGAARVHGITQKKAMELGVALPPVLDAFEQQLEQADLLVAHNINFDYHVLGAEFIRTRKNNPLAGKRQLCTMKHGTDYCALPGKYGYKWPSLTELHQKLFGKGFAEAHNALRDVEACRDCLLELKKKGVIVL